MLAQVIRSDRLGDPASLFVCETGGMLVICPGTTGYVAVADLRYLWVRQKRRQRPHGTNDAQARAYNQLVHEGAIDPRLGRVISFDELPAAHVATGAGQDVFGNVVVLVGAGSEEDGRESGQT